MSDRPPAEQWWTINGAELLAALQRAHDGDTPDMVYLELHANSDGGTDYGDPDAADDQAHELALLLAGHSRINPPGGTCTCGFETGLGELTSRHVADAVIAAGWVR